MVREHCAWPLANPFKLRRSGHERREPLGLRSGLMAPLSPDSSAWGSSFGRLRPVLVSPFVRPACRRPARRPSRFLCEAQRQPPAMQLVSLFHNIF